MNSLWGNVFKGRKKEKDTVRDILKRVPIFEALGKGELDRIERILHRREYAQDEVIFFQGQPGLGVYVPGRQRFPRHRHYSGIANLIPFLGPVAGAAAAVIVSVIDRGDLAGAGLIVAAFVIMKLIDDTVVQPLVVARSVDLHPLVVLLVVIVGGRSFGVLGMLLSIPLIGFMKVIIAESNTALRRYRLT